MSFQHPPPAHPTGPGEHPTYAGGPVSSRRAWFAEFLDQLALLGFVLFWLGITFLAGTRLEDPPSALIGGGVLTAIFGVIVLALVEAWVAARHGTTVGRFLLGIRIHPAARLTYLDSLELIFEFWQFTFINAGTSLLDRVLPDGAPSEGFAAGTARDPRCHGIGARCARFLLGLVLLLSPLPMVLAFVG